MSFPTKDTIFGFIKYKNQEYDLLNQPMDDFHLKVIAQYKKENGCGFSTAPWNTNRFEWIIEENRLYLKSIKLKLCKKSENLIYDIFKTDRLYAFWLNKDIKLFVSKRELDTIRKGKILTERKILILSFKNGFLKNIKKEVEQYYSFKLN